MNNINKNNKKPERMSFSFMPFSCTLGDKYSCKHIYDCRLMDYRTGKQDRVRVCASNFGEVKWCMMGYTKLPLVMCDSTIRITKHLVMPDDIGQKNFVCIVVREK